MNKGKWTRWHRFDSKGVKMIRKFDIGEKPVNEPGYTEWKRGTGPMSPETYENVTNAVRKACLGVPKSEEQKLKMRLAKLGVPKTEEHRKNMSLAAKKRRQEKYLEVMKKMNNG